MIGAIFMWALFGLIIGFLAKFIMPGKEGGGILSTMGIGIGGAIIGGAIGKVLGLGGVNGFSFWSMLLALAGAIIIIYVYNKVKKK